MIMLAAMLTMVSLAGLKSGYPEALLVWLIIPLTAYAARDCEHKSTEGGSGVE